MRGDPGLHRNRGRRASRCPAMATPPGHDPNGPLGKERADRLVPGVSHAPIARSIGRHGIEELRGGEVHEHPHRGCDARASTRESRPLVQPRASAGSVGTGPTRLALTVCMLNLKRSRPDGGRPVPIRASGRRRSPGLTPEGSRNAVSDEAAALDELRVARTASPTRRTVRGDAPAPGRPRRSPGETEIG